MIRSKEKNFQSNMHFHLIIQNCHTLTLKPCPEGHEIYNFSRGLPVIHTSNYAYSFSSARTEVIKEDF